MLYFHATSIEFGGRTLPVAALSRDGAIVATALDRAPTRAKAEFAERGWSIDRDDPGPFWVFLDELERYAAGERVTFASPVASAFDDEASSKSPNSAPSKSPKSSSPLSDSFSMAAVLACAGASNSPRPSSMSS